MFARLWMEGCWGKVLGKGVRGRVLGRVLGVGVGARVLRVRCRGGF